MTDRELLDLAAKAIGAHWDPSREAWYFPPTTFRKDWNPLTDDGDAFRLAVKLRITVRLEDPAAVSAGWAENQHVPFTNDGNGPWYWKEWGRILDPAACTRRAIVRASAAIGSANGDAA